MKLSLSKEKQEIVNSFLNRLGDEIRIKREGAGLSQADLGKEIGVDGNLLGKYERGERDMHVSTLPLLSAACGYPLSDLFTKELAESLLASLGPYVSITRKRYARKRDEIGKASEEVLTAYIYVKDGVEIRKEVTIRPLSFSLKTQLRNGDYDTGLKPFTDKEMCDYLENKVTDEIKEFLLANKSLMENMKNSPGAKRVINAICDYVIDSIFINPVLDKKGDDSCRAYEYYRQCLGKLNLKNN